MSDAGGRIVETRPGNPGQWCDDHGRARAEALQSNRRDLGGDLAWRRRARNITKCAQCRKFPRRVRVDGVGRRLAGARATSYRAAGSTHVGAGEASSSGSSWFQTRGGLAVFRFGFIYWSCRYSVNLLPRYGVGSGILPQFADIHAPKPLRNSHGPQAHYHRHEHVHSIVIEPVMSTLHAPALMTFFMDMSTLTSHRCPGSPGPTQSRSIGHRLGGAQLCITRRLAHGGQSLSRSTRGLG